MPGGDRTGPMGEGPMTGWQRGSCTGDSVPDTTNSGFRGGRGRGFGRGRGRGGGRGMAWRHGQRGGRGGFWGHPEPDQGALPGPTGPSRDAELNTLRDQATHIEGALEDIKRRIAELEQKPGEEE